MYKNPNGSLKGDARCCFLKYESVVLACDLLDGSTFKGNEIKGICFCFTYYFWKRVYYYRGRVGATKLTLNHTSEISPL